MVVQEAERGLRRRESWLSERSSSTSGSRILRWRGAENTAAARGSTVSPQIVAAQAKEGSPKLEYGLGFGVGVAEGRRWFGHNGGAPGVNVEAAVYPDDRTAVIVMSNRDPPAATVLFRKLRAMLFDPGLVKSCASSR
jgi:CubicO group peptidase (beta-lactamase class C family)